jgi:hypothetical protein
VLIIPSSWGSQLVGDLYINTVRIKLFSGAVAGEEKTSARGVLHAHPLLYFCFALLYFCLHRFIKNTKN